MLHKINRVLLPAGLLAIGLLLTACSGGGDSAPAIGAIPTPAPNNPRYAFVANSGDNSVSSYVVDSATGRLKWIAKVAAGLNPNAVTVDPSGRYAYVANLGSASVSQYTIAADGSLTPMATATVAAGTWPVSVTVDPSGRYAYVANNDSANVSQYTITADGSLTPMATATVASGTGPHSVTTTGSWQ